MNQTLIPRDLGQEAYERIRDAIREGSLTPGLRLTEIDLAARVGASRTPVRQAQLHRLLAGAAEKENDLVAFGTVGAVALDAHGNVAAATSTGGMTGKRWGRVGDSPIIGAGTYANNASCAVSATGHGECFIRSVVAHDICAQVEYLKLPLATAVRTRSARSASVGCGARAGGSLAKFVDGGVPCPSRPAARS